MDKEYVKAPWGGYRVGAGRKKNIGRDYQVGYKITKLAKDNITAYAAKLGISASEAVNRLFESLQPE